MVQNLGGEGIGMSAGRQIEHLAAPAAAHWWYVTAALHAPSKVRATDNAHDSRSYHS